MKTNFSYFFFFILFFFTACSEDSADFNASPTSEANGQTGIAGSYARFMAVGDYLYIVDNERLKTLSIVNPEAPEITHQQNIGQGIETIYHLDGRLFIGSSEGLFIYTISAETGIPSLTAEYGYDYPILPCDPVVANDSLAFVTLNTNQVANSPCGGSIITVDVLKIFDIKDIDNPKLINEYPMHNPKGVGIDGELLFLCDDTQGLKIYDFSNPLNLKLVYHYTGITTYDVIPLNGLLLVVGPDNVYQFDYSDPYNLVLLSQIPIQS